MTSSTTLKSAASPTSTDNRVTLGVNAEGAALDSK